MTKDGNLHFAKQKNLYAGGFSRKPSYAVDYCLESNENTNNWSEIGFVKRYLFYKKKKRFCFCNHSALQTETNTHTNNALTIFYIHNIKLITRIPLFSRPTHNFLWTHYYSELPLRTSKNTLTFNNKKKIWYVSPLGENLKILADPAKAATWERCSESEKK